MIMTNVRCFTILCHANVLVFRIGTLVFIKTLLSIRSWSFCSEAVRSCCHHLGEQRRLAEAGFELFVFQPIAKGNIIFLRQETDNGFCIGKSIETEYSLFHSTLFLIMKGINGKWTIFCRLLLLKLSIT